jgi:hypothetical protein
VNCQKMERNLKSFSNNFHYWGRIAYFSCSRVNKNLLTVSSKLWKDLIVIPPLICHEPILHGSQKLAMTAFSGILFLLWKYLLFQALPFTYSLTLLFIKAEKNLLVSYAY